MPASAIGLLYSHRRLLLRVASNELSARYAGSVLGFSWALVYPLIVLAIYTFVYSAIFRVSVPGMASFTYILYIFAGLVPVLVTSESIANGITSVLASKSVLANTVFPIDLTPPKAVLLSQITTLVGFGSIVLIAFATGVLPWTVCLLPVVVLLHVMALIGITWILSLLTIVLRDLQPLINLSLMMITIASPVAYTPEMVPERLRPLLLLNPLAYYVVVYQKVTVLGRLPTIAETTFLLFMSTALFVGGSAFFSRVKYALVDYV